MQAITTATIGLINTQTAYRQYVEINGIDAGDPGYQQVLQARNAAASAYETELAAFVAAQ